MGLIENMGKKGRAGVKLPVPTTAGDDQVIAAKTGEYVLPPEVVAAIGVEKLNALVQSITGQAPGGEPAEMPEGAMHEMMEGEAEGYAKGGCVKGMKGYATGGLISKFSASPLNADPLQDNRESLRKYGFDGGMGSDSVATEISRAAKGMPMADEVMEAGMDKMAQKTMQPQRKRRGISDLRDLEAMGALGEDSNIMGFNKGGLISRMKGYAEGGIVEDDYTRRKLSGYNPQETIRQPMAGRPAPVDPNVLRNYNPQSTIRQPVSPGAPAPVDANALRGYNPQASIPPNATTNASPRAPELRSFTPEAGRLQPGSVGPRISGLAAQPSAGTPSATVRALDARVPGDAAAVEAQRAKAAAQAGRLTGQAQSAAATAAAPPKQGLISRAAQKATPSRATVAGGLAGAGMAGAGQAIADIGSGYRDEFNRSVGAESTMGTVAADTARTLAAVGDAATFGLAGRVGRGIASATGGGSFGEGFASDSDRDRFLASKQPQQVAAAPQLTPQQNSDEIARRRAALEGPQAAPTPTPNATPTQAAVAAPAPARGPVSGLAARAAKQSPAAPAAASIDPAVMADAQAAQAQLDQSPIARVVGGTGGTMTIQYKDGTTKQVGQEGMDEVNGFYGLTSRAAKQYDAQPVEVIAGASRGQAVPELGYQVVPDAVARTGKTGDYVQSLSQAAMDRADPVAAELRARLAEITAQGDNSIRVSNATDKDGEGRGIRNELARLEFDLKKRALAGDPAAIQQLNMLRGAGSQDEYNATTREVPVDPANPMLGTVKEPVIFNKRTGLPVQGGTVQSSSAAPQSAVAALRKDPKLAAQFDAKYGQGASAQYLNAR